MAISFFPAIPDDVSDDFLTLSATQAQRRAKLLFGALLLTTPTAYFAASTGAAAWVRFGTPLAMALFCIAGFLNLNRDLKLNRSVRRARAFILEATIGSGVIAVMCSAWCVFSWFGAVEESRIYYPVIIALGAFSTAYCLSTIAQAATANIVINITPMIILLVASGDRMNIAVAMSLLIAAGFQLHMIREHQKDIIRLLELQRTARDLSLTDPLTGLLNRRALLDQATRIGDHADLRLILADIDMFKSINDSHGHDVGDAVLVAVANVLRARVGDSGKVARIGGEEFAIVGTADALSQSIGLGLLADMRAAALPQGLQATISLGIAEGCAASDADWQTLFKQADAALYEAKSSGRNRLAIAPQPETPVAAAA